MFIYFESSEITINNAREPGRFYVTSRGNSSNKRLERFVMLSNVVNIDFRAFQINNHISKLNSFVELTLLHVYARIFEFIR